MLSRDTQDAGDDDVLECRRHVMLATRERLTLLGGSWDPARERVPSVLTVANRPLQQLTAVLDALPWTAPGDAAPTDLLPGPPADHAVTTVDRWRCAARNVALANHELSASVDQPWLSSNRALWHLAGDVAGLVEAVLVLDEGLVHRGMLPGTSPSVRTAHRLITGDVARLARWFGNDRSPDSVYASPLSQLGTYDGPRIHMVHRSEDLIVAQRTLTALLRYRKGEEPPRAGLRAARVLSVGQIRLANIFAGWADESEDGHRFANQFRRRIAAYKSLHRATVRLVEIAPTQSALVVAQQSEMLTQLRRLQASRPSADVLANLNEASHDVSVSLGRTLRREGMTRKNILVLREHGRGLPRPRPITNTNEPFHVACKALADDPVPETACDGQWTGVHRQRLRASLDRTPAPLPHRARSISDAPSRGTTVCRPHAQTFER